MGISASCIVAPAGYLRTDGEEEDEESEDFQGNPLARDLEVNDEADKMSARALLDLENWQHTRPALSQQQARTRYWKPPKENKYEEDDEALEIEDIPPILREISADGKNMEERTRG